MSSLRQQMHTGVTTSSAITNGILGIGHKPLHASMQPPTGNARSGQGVTCFARALLRRACAGTSQVSLLDNTSASNGCARLVHPASQMTVLAKI